ncbi:hypothetical protein PSTG_05433 [Puccinia striiformis f. sp. tritici PST-78]|uniref:Uncharacterized protein n=1 Tax=Puccinia striiformis f. sp. tritici PST-78 TaxID=1165861 RepID=A0A0L0VPY3_9BASI|nr:hypothetical protein PSTG_05433 [Puccinia striiformis f. sp. tritici PST-78]
MQSQAIPSNPAVSRDKRRPHMQFARHGLWVNEWVATAGEKVSEFLQVPTGYLDKSSDLNASELRLPPEPTASEESFPSSYIRALVAQLPDTCPPLPFYESLFVRVAEGFVKVGPQVKDALALKMAHSTRVLVQVPVPATFFPGFQTPAPAPVGAVVAVGVNVNRFFA